MGFNNYPQKGNLTKDKGIYNKIMNQVKHLPFSQKKKKKKKQHLLPDSSTGKISDSWIRNLEFHPHLHQKPIMSWFDDKELSSRADAIGWNSKKKKKKLTL